MTNHYTPGPEQIPAEILKVTSSFKKKVFLALIGLIAFITFYFGLMIWFGYQTYHLFYILTHGADNPFFIIITGLCFAILTIFMFKSLIFFKKKEDIPYKQLTKAEQPELYDFIHEVAKETGAPAPHKIYLSDRVNASVFYDLSLINILIPSKKNLEVGMGLLNVLNLTEFKAILAHEFGHFAQRSMLLGRYVYVAQQLATRIVHKRDILDQALSGLSSFDLRIAWVGWILSIIVWAIRSLIDVLFGIVVISERALSREMEFQADNVAVSVTGSDALIYGLHKLRAADEGYRESITILNKCLQDKKAIPNLYSLQSNYIKKMRWVLNDPNYGMISENIVQKENVRLFKNGLINPPEMWSTHPSDMDRENNAKRSYLRVEIDQRGAVELVRNEKDLFEEITGDIIKSVKVETELITDEESIEIMNHEMFEWTFLDPQFKSVYLNRSSMRNFDSISDIYAGELYESIEIEYKALYPDSIKEELELHREYEEEINLLEATKNQVRTAENRKIVHRGNEISRKMIPAIIERLKAQEITARQKLADHDQKCRLVNYHAANTLHPSYGEYLKSIAQVLHYAEHTLADLIDVHQKFNGTLFVIFADNRVTETEELLLISEARAMRKVMHFTCRNAEKITLNDTLLSKLKIKKSEDLFEEFNLEEPDMGNIQGWLEVYASWYEVCVQGLTRLRNCSLELLLNSETIVQKDYLLKENNFKFDKMPIIDDDYPRICNGNERKVVEKLTFWDKFHGGIGLFPTIAKFSAAAIILIGAIFIGRISIESTLYIQNAFDQELRVSINGTTYSIDPKSQLTTIISEDAEILTKTLNGRTIDIFTGKYDAGNQNYIYNIGYGDYFVEYETVYGIGEPSEAIYIGSSRWMPAHADYIMEEAPLEIRTKYSGETRSTIAPILDDPFSLPELNYQDKEFQKMISNHVQFDSPNSQYMANWLSMMLTFDPELIQIQKVARKSRENIPAQRILMDAASESEKENLNVLYKKLFAKTGNPDFKYLEIRALEDSPEQDVAFVQASKKYPENGWLNLAAGYLFARDENWKLADEHYSKIINGSQNVREIVVLDYVKIHRLQCELTNSPFVNSNYYLHEQIEYQLRLDAGDQTITSQEGEMIPYYLSLEKYDMVRDLLPTLPVESQGHYLWMLAASQPDNQAAFDEAMNLDQNVSINAINYPIALALMASRNNDYSELEEFLSRVMTERDIASMLAFVNAIQTKNMSSARGIIDNVSNYQIGTNLKLIACIMMKEKVPQDWWRQVNSLLFVSDKPYIGYCIR
ncbi:MAG: hypothetical protein COA38_00085 [Fluviicola sp.]|nr:MAG: hypothetical protein COA38_00085 [Fluviicola sp.]